MNTISRADLLRRSYIANSQRLSQSRKLRPSSHTDYVRQALRSVGIRQHVLGTMETRYLPRILHDDEVLGGAVYGWHKGEGFMLVATDRRIIYLDRKPMFMDEDEISYNVVSGIRYGSTGIGATVELHTRIKNYTIFTFNKKSAARFVSYIEGRCLEQASGPNFNM